MLTEEDRINLELIKKIMTEKKINNQDWEKEKVETKKINKLLVNIPTQNITEVNELIYVNLCWSKISQWKNRYLPRELEQKYQTWIGN